MRSAPETRANRGVDDREGRLSCRDVCKATSKRNGGERGQHLGKIDRTERQCTSTLPPIVQAKSRLRTLATRDKWQRRAFDPEEGP